MKPNAHLFLPLLQREAAPPPRRWWLGWLQLLCAWLLCMLLCANVALVLAKGSSPDEGPAVAKKPVDCTMPAEAVAGSGRGESVSRTLRRIPRCSGS